MGGFVLALGLERCGLHKRIALSVLNKVGTKPSAIIGGFMLASAALSMWVTNTATCMMMLPIAISVVRLAEGKIGEEKLTDFAPALMLAAGKVGVTCSLLPSALNT